MREDRFLTALFKRLPAASPPLIVGPGDDCAALSGNGDSLLLIAVDQIVGGRHYSDETGSSAAATAAETVGRKLLARNLSDIAAMGGTPTFCLLSLALGSRKSRDEGAWLDRFLNGLLALAGRYGVQLIGGDLAAAPHDDIGSLTILGTVPKDQICRRGGARPGDHLYVTGWFGDSFDSGHHLHFTPRCEEGRWLAENHLPRAMIDVSDGVLMDGLRLCRAGGLSLQLDLGTIPLRNPQRSIQQALSDGEDYELMFAVSPENSRSLSGHWPFGQTRLTRIGVFTDGQPPDIIDLKGRSLTENARLGYDHWQP